MRGRRKNSSMSDEEKKKSVETIEKVLSFYFNKSIFARELNVSTASLNRWLDGKCVIPAGMAYKIEAMFKDRKDKIADMEVSAHMLRPDIFNKKRKMF